MCSDQMNKIDENKMNVNGYHHKMKSNELMTHTLCRLVPLKLKFWNFFIFLRMLFGYSYRLQKSKFKVGVWALFLR